MVLQGENAQAAESLKALPVYWGREKPHPGRQAAEMLQEMLNRRTTPLREAAIHGANTHGRPQKGLQSRYRRPVRCITQPTLATIWWEVRSLTSWMRCGVD